MATINVHTLDIKLPGQRTARCSIFGDLSLRRSVFYFHGYPGSRLEAGLASTSAARHGISVIGVDRPGFGGTSHYPSRKLLDWPADVASIADHLGIASFGILGCSGGVPYTLACAYALAERITCCGLVSGLGPVDKPADLRDMNFLNRALLLCASRQPQIAYGIVSAIARIVRASPRLLVNWLRLISPRSDKAILSRREVQELLISSFAAGLSGPTCDVAADLGVLVQPWGFKLEAVKVPIHLWHGSADDYVPMSMGQSMSAKLPNCHTHFIPSAGHFMIVDLIDEIICTLMPKAA